jgi:hypothetical protein
MLAAQAGKQRGGQIAEHLLPQGPEGYMGGCHCDLTVSLLYQ